MECVDVLFVNLPTGAWYKDKLATSNSMPPLGLLYLAASVSELGYQVKLVDFAVEEFTIDKLAYYMSFKPKIIGMSTYNESWKMQQLLCEYISENYSDVVLVAGGAFATFCYESVLTKTATKYVIRGEGEKSFSRLCELVLSNTPVGNIEDIPGICYLDCDNNVVNNGLSDRVIDLDLLPFPKRDLVSDKNYTMPYTICTSRGCPGDCIFCSSRAFWGKKVVLRSAKSVFDEVVNIYENYNAKVFYIAHDTFTASMKRCYDFCSLIQEFGVSFSWGCESRADVVTEELIKNIKDAGCNKIQFGFESADNNVLRQLKKKVTIEQIENAIKIAYKYNMHIQASYIIGHAFDTKETIEKTLSYAKKFKSEYGVRVVSSVNTPFPGTEQYESASELGITIHTRDWTKYMLNCPIIRTAYLSESELRYYFSKSQEI